MRALHAVILDFDGVIANSEGLHLRAYQDVLAGTGMSISDQAYFERYLGFDDVGVLRAVAADAGRTAGRRHAGRPDRRQGPALRGPGQRRRNALSRRRRLHPAGRRRGAAGDRVGSADPRDRGRAAPHRAPRPAPGGRRRRSDGAVEAGARSVPGSVRPDRGRDRAAPRSAAHRRRRGLAVGTGVGARRRPAHRGGDQHLRRPTRWRAHAELVVSGLAALQLDDLDRLCER